MHRKPNTPSDNFRQGYDAGYKDGWNTRDKHSLQDDFSLWDWADWFVYVGLTLLAVSGALAIFGLLTIWISWASDHRQHPHCEVTSTGEQWCTND